MSVYGNRSISKQHYHNLEQAYRSRVREHFKDVDPYKNGPTVAADSIDRAFRSAGRKLRLGRRYAKRMQRMPTAAEQHVRQVLLAAGIKHDWQRVVTFQSRPGCRVVDFFFPESYVVLELDGSSHEAGRPARGAVCSGVPPLPVPACS